ncbi:J domain-containing protein [[Candida] zeylanoides]
MPEDESGDEDDANSFEFDGAHASTPLRLNPMPNRASAAPDIFSSPVTKLSNLHLEASSPKSFEPLDEESCLEAEQTILSDGSVDFINEHDAEVTLPPVYLNSKKRGIDHSLDMIITPCAPHDSSKRVPTASADLMSICGSNSSKLSFSNSDSTPCPPQPRKRLKFKSVTPSGTPSNVGGTRKKLLNLGSSTRVSASILTQLNTVRHDDFAEDDDSPPPTEPMSAWTGTLTADTTANTPISQSTPANSRAPTPPQLSSSPSPPKVTPGPKAPPVAEEFGEPINGYKFVRLAAEPRSSQPYYSYKTPESTHSRNEVPLVRNGAGASRYEIVGEFPVTSAGLMDENDEDLHIGDRRINDPYLNPRDAPKSQRSAAEAEQERRQRVTREYLSSTNAADLPLLKLYEGTRDAMDKQTILSLINDNSSVLEFYQFISTNALDTIKRDRIRWHPDKWRARGTDSDKEIVDNLSQVLNALVERLSW